MTEENNNATQEETKELDAQSYVEAIADIRKNTVPKEDYEKLKKDNEVLKKSLKNGMFRADDEEDEASKVDIDAYKKKLFVNPRYQNDLSFITDVLKLRNAVIESGSPDPFLPNSRDYSVKGEDISTAKEVADALQECVDKAEGDPSLFTSEMKRYGFNMEEIKRRLRR